MKSLFSILLVIALVCSRAQAAMPEVEASAFIKDLDFLALELPKRHANLYHASTKESFSTAIAKLRSRLPELERAEAIVALAGIVGMAQDGHTALFLLPFPGSAPIPEISQLPVQFMSFSDGIRIVAIERAHSALLGAKLTAVGTVPVAQALTLITPLLPRDNDQGVREYAPFYLALPQVLQALGLSTQSQTGEYTLQLGTSTRTLKLTSSSAPEMGWMSQLISLPGARESWVGAGENLAKARWLSRPSSAWWFETLPNGDVYAQINGLRETADVRFSDFATALLAAVPKTGDSRLILDLRLNRGGNAELLWPLIYAIIRHDAVNHSGRLYSLISRRTFSAAQNLANALEKHTQVQFVGEPTGSSPNHYGELGVITLPQTGLKVFVSLLQFQYDPRDRRPWIAPHLAAELSYEDLAQGRDPALAAIERYQPPPALSELLAQDLRTGAYSSATEQVRALAKRYPNPWRNRFEVELNGLGYQQLSKKNVAAAEALFVLNTELYPRSSNAWDSRGEAHLAAGRRSAAAFAYARAVHLDPAAHYSATALNSILGVMP